MTDQRLAVGAEARRRGQARIGGHLQPCLLRYCQRPECRGWSDEDAAIRARAGDTLYAHGDTWADAMAAMDPDLDVCPNCEGAGAIWDDQTGQPDEPNGGRMVTCTVCEGDGRVDMSPCIACGGRVYDHDEGCPLLDHPGSLPVQAQALADKAAKEVQR